MKEFGLHKWRNKMNFKGAKTTPLLTEWHAVRATGDREKLRKFIECEQDRAAVAKALAAFERPREASTCVDSDWYNEVE